MNDKTRKIKYLSYKWAIPMLVFIGLLFLFSLSNHIIEYFISFFYKNIVHPSKFDESTTAAIGNTLSGTLGVVIAAIASYLTFLAFWVQYTANQSLKRDLAIERFENKFYQLLQIHRNNVNEMRINNNTHGRKAFSRFYTELEFIYFYCQNTIDMVAPTFSKEKAFNISYLIFFFGCGQTSSRMVSDILSADHESLKIFEILVTEINKATDDYREELLLESHERYNIKAKTGRKNQEYIEFYYDYTPFQGHLGNLSHYFRNLFQFVKFIDENYPIKNNHQAKQEYVNTLRSQLSIHEQAMLYYNSLSVLGKPWHDAPNGEEGLMEKYSVLKSLPNPLADFYIVPTEQYSNKTKNKNNGDLFEWTAIKERFKNLA